MYYVGFRDAHVWNSCFEQFLIYLTMKPGFRWVYENTGCKGRFTNYAAERSSLGGSENPSSFKSGFGEIWA